MSLATYQVSLTDFSGLQSLDKSSLSYASIFGLVTGMFANDVLFQCLANLFKMPNFTAYNIHGWDLWFIL